MIRCRWQIAYGLPWEQLCNAEITDPCAVYCEEHEQDWHDLYPHLQVPRTTRKEDTP